MDGGGSELCLGKDMRFGAADKAILARLEVALGIIQGGGGTQRLTRLLGPGRALEVSTGCADFSAEEAERYDNINRALPSKVWSLPALAAVKDVGLVARRQ